MLDSPLRSRLASTDEIAHFQAQALEGVSRTFALTIPQLPETLQEPITTAYLICRIADTIEDDPALTKQDKSYLLSDFADVVYGSSASRSFATRLLNKLSRSNPVSERNLVEHTELVIDALGRLSTTQQAAIQRCTKKMTAGMAEFGGGTPGDLKTIDDLERYTYCVAGVVGEMLTEIICDYSPAIEEKRGILYPLSKRFGSCLQIVNIIKDMWEDQQRGTCWLPQAVFPASVDLASLANNHKTDLVDGVTRLVLLARDHLDGAFEYTLQIPAKESGIRRFLLWTLGFAVLTLLRIAKNPTFSSGDQVKISRGYVKATVLTTSLLARSDASLSWLYHRLVASLPR